MWNPLPRIFRRRSNSHPPSRVLDTVADPNQLPTHPLAATSSPFPPSGTLSEPGMIPVQEPDPSVLYPVLRYLRDRIPDVSAGVWAWVRLCNTPQSLHFDGGSQSDLHHARQILADLDERIHEFTHVKGQGMQALVGSFFLSVFTYGAFAGEVVLSNNRKRIDKFYIIDPAMIRFRRTQRERRLLPFQLLPNGTTIQLNPGSFFYYGLDAEGDSPYGRSPLLAVPLIARIQQQMVIDIARASHNAGYPTLHVKYTPGSLRPGESPSAYNERTAREFNEIRDRLREKKPDSNFITFDNIEVDYIGPTGSRTRWQESLQAISEQVISALHLAPFMLGRNWGTTESWGTAQYQLLTNHARTVQENAKRMIEWLRNLELSLHGIPVLCRHEFSPHRKLDELGAARAESVRVKTGLELLDRDILTTEEFSSLYVRPGCRNA